MPGLNAPLVGSQNVLAFLLSDPLAASQLASVLTAAADAQNYTGLYGLLGLKVPMLLNAAGNYDRQRSAIGTTGIAATNTEGTKATYATSVVGFTPAATATDFINILGSGTKTVRITRIQLSGTATAAATVDIQLIKRTTANSSGTPTPLTPGLYDSNDASATAVISTYAANPTTGTGGGVVRGQRLNLGAAGAAGSIVWDFTTRNSKGLVLRGVSQSFNLNWGGAAVPSGTSLSFDVEWTEE